MQRGGWFTYPGKAPFKATSSGDWPPEATSGLLGAAAYLSGCAVTVSTCFTRDSSAWYRWMALAAACCGSSARGSLYRTPASFRKRDRRAFCAAAGSVGDGVWLTLATAELGVTPGPHPSSSCGMASRCCGRWPKLKPVRPGDRMGDMGRRRAVPFGGPGDFVWGTPRRTTSLRWDMHFCAARGVMARSIWYSDAFVAKTCSRSSLTSTDEIRFFRPSCEGGPMVDTLLRLPVDDRV